MSDFSSRYKADGRGGNPDAAVNSNAIAQLEMLTGRTIPRPGQIQIAPNVFVSRIGLSGKIDTESQWKVVGLTLRAIESGLQWAIGDWLNMGQKRWGETYEQFAESLGYELQTLYDYAYVSRQVDFSIRIEKLSFAHHRIVAPLQRDDQELWLDKAAKDGWSVARLRRALDAPSGPAPRVPVFVRFLAAVDKWRDRLEKVPAEDRHNLATALRQMADELERESE